MAHGSHEFVLVGYSEYLERRPLKFADPISAAIVCSACGYIPRQTFSLVCGHVLCEPCHRSCASTSQCVCPLDGDVSGPDDVISRKHPAENLLRRQVLCWNEVNGCRVVLPASQMAEHVRHDCRYHVTRCPSCLAEVLSSDVCAHLKSRCAELVFRAVPAPQEATDNTATTQLVAFEKKVEQRVGDLDARLARLSLESSSQNDKLVELCHNINHLNEALTEQFGRGSLQTLDRLDRNDAEMKALVAREKTIEQRVGEIDSKLAQLSLESGLPSVKLLEVCHNIDHLKEALTQQLVQVSERILAAMTALYAKKSESLMAAITSIAGSVPSHPRTHQRVVTGYEALKEKALNDGWSRSMSEMVYLSRYLISWAIDFKKEGDSLNLFLAIQLHEGREDEFLDWPFRKELKLTFIHPMTRQERHLACKPDSTEASGVCYCRPIQGFNTSMRFTETRVHSSDIERDGYVEKDKLLLRFEVLL